MKKRRFLFVFSTFLLCGCTHPSSVSSSIISTMAPTTTVSTSSSEIKTTTSVTPISSASNSSLSSSSFYIDGYHLLYEGLYVNYLPSLYSEEIEVSFLVTNPDLELYYTLDCSTPTRTYTLEYKKPIPIRFQNTKDPKDYPLTTSVDGILAEYGNDKCTSNAYNQNIQLKGEYIFLPKQTVITIMLYNKETRKAVFQRSLTYFLDLEQSVGIPLISLSMPYKDWFGNNGFYNQIRSEIEKRANLEYYDITTDEYFYRNTQVKLGGNWTLGYPQRTLNLNFNKDENGNKNEPVTASLFPHRLRRDQKGEVDSYTRFRLHNRGNSFEESIGLNDAFVQALMENDYNVSTTGYRPCLVYCNGEYWGMYSIREHYKKQYFSSHYGVKKDDVILYDLKGGFNLSDGDETEANECLNALRDYIALDFHDDSVYEKFIEEYMDIDSFIDVILANAYCSNWDFIGNFNNLKMWRTSKIKDNNPYADGRWRFVIHDTDFAFRENTNYLDRNVNNSYSRFFFLGQLLKSELFRNRMMERATHLMETCFNLEKSLAILDQLMEEIQPYYLASMFRWGQKSNYNSYWKSQINEVKNNLTFKSQYFLSILKDTLKQYN